MACHPRFAASGGHYHRGHRGRLPVRRRLNGALLAAAAVPVAARLNDGLLRVLITGAAFVLGAAVALGVIGLHWHYFTDTVAGAAVGIGTVRGLALLLDLSAVRRQLARASRQWPTAQPKARE